MTAKLSLFFEDGQARANGLLESRLSALPKDRLRDAMIYAVMIGGKRIRPLFCFAASSLFGPSTPLTDDAAVALELIHAYSLIHDDLPAMDDDDLRRGQPTCHIAFDEAMAILAGDALQALAFHVLAGDDKSSGDDSLLRLRLIRILAHAAGAQGMVLGQALDLVSVNNRLSLPELEQMHNCKTGALIKAGIIMGALAGGASDRTDLNALTAYADAVGLAFQVKDDILDVESATEVLGKRQGADEALNKPTYTSMLGIEGAKAKLADLHAQAHMALEPFGPRGENLRAMADFVVGRAF